MKGDGIDGSSLAKRVMGTSWTWAGIEKMQFHPGGKLQTPCGDGVWGALPKTSSGGEFCEAGCLFADFSSALHNLRFDFSSSPASFKTWRVGDGESIEGKLIAM